MAKQKTVERLGSEVRFGRPLTPGQINNFLACLPDRCCYFCALWHKKKARPVWREGCQPIVDWPGECRFLPPFGFAFSGGPEKEPTNVYYVAPVTTPGYWCAHYVEKSEEEDDDGEV